MRHLPRRVFLVTMLSLTACGGVAPLSSYAAGHLAPCPPKPHCVSTSSVEPADRHMDPIAFSGTPAAARKRLLAVVLDESRAVVVVDSASYVRVAIPTLVFRFVDDVEFIIDSSTQRIEFRSSARFGYNDWGVNRARMDRVTARLRQ